MNETVSNGKFGQSVKRVEDARLITGRGRFVDDLVFPGQTYAAFVRSPYAHATIAGIDLEAAQDMPGVIRIFTGRELAVAALPPLPSF